MKKLKSASLGCVLVQLPQCAELWVSYVRKCIPDTHTQTHTRQLVTSGALQSSREGHSQQLHNRPSLNIQYEGQLVITADGEGGVYLHQVTALGGHAIIKFF